MNDFLEFSFFDDENVDPYGILFHAMVGKVRSSYGPLAYFSDIFISGKNVVVFSVQKRQHFCHK